MVHTNKNIQTLIHTTHTLPTTHKNVFENRDFLHSKDDSVFSSAYANDTIVSWILYKKSKFSIHLWYFIVEPSWISLENTLRYKMLINNSMIVMPNSGEILQIIECYKGSIYTILANT